MDYKWSNHQSEWLMTEWAHQKRHYSLPNVKWLGKGADEFGLNASFSSERWIAFEVTILAKEGKARMIAEDIGTHSFQKKENNIMEMSSADLIR